jgi:xanthine/CO dehydrogenase XdhC/CoxF family maturation factor
VKEFKAILTEYNKIDFSQRKAALATIVNVIGSSYRGPGARMLITDDGKWVGSISGGCLEGDALRKARQVIANKKTMTVTYDTREESNQNLGIGLGCNGVIDVLIEPIDNTDENNPVFIFNDFISNQEPLALATIYTGENTGKKLLINKQQVIKNSLPNESLHFISGDLKEIFISKKSLSKVYLLDGKETEVFLELIQPTITLIIFGGGFDARPVSQLAKTLGWDVQVTDECVAHIAPIFFPQADKLSLCSREFIDRDFQITRYTACVLMSHNYEYDRDVLRKLLRTETPYIGILGPKKRFDKMQAEFLIEGIELSHQDFDRIHSPIGLDIGAEAADEIAVSIIAEIQAKFSNRMGSFLKERVGSIHIR